MRGGSTSSCALCIKGGLQKSLQVKVIDKKTFDVVGTEELLKISAMFTIVLMIMKHTGSLCEHPGYSIDTYSKDSILK